MTIIEAIIQGIVQGATEFLPVSSSGHLSLAQHVMGVELDSLLFDIVLHVGTLIAVMAVYRKLIGRLIVEAFTMIGDIFKKRFSFKNMSEDRRLLLMLVVGLIPLVLLFLPVPGTDMKVKDLSDMWATDSNILVESFAFLGTSTLLFLSIFFGKKNNKNENKKGSHFEMRRGRKQIYFFDAVVIGIAQFLAAVFPGLSRSGSTMSAGVIKGVDKSKALDYSFVLGIPAILAAAVLSLGDIASSGESLSPEVLIAGLVASAVVGFLAIILLKWIVATDKMIIFAVYTLILGIVCIVISVIEMRSGMNIFSHTML